MLQLVFPFSAMLLMVFTSPHSLPQRDEKTVMAVYAHPDDEIFISPVLAKYAREGHKVYLVLATNGDKGTRKHAAIPAGDSLSMKRKQEAGCACEKLGIQPPVFLDLSDGELDVDFTGVPLRRKIDSVFKIYKPDVVVTWGPDGGYGHLDHRMVHNVVTEIYQSGTSPYPGSLFYSAVNTSNWLNKPQLKTGMLNFFHSSWKTVKEAFLSVRIKTSKEDIDKSFDAMRCHWSQFTSEEMDDLEIWLTAMNKNDTIYFRPFSGSVKANGFFD